MTEREFIEHIRSKYAGMEDIPRESLASSVKTLADDLYSKDSHFIFELIQNAEDNHYGDSVSPKLTFDLREIKIEGIEYACLVVGNNETGFTRSNVRALCQVGRSTKQKIQGYIGEKGIGFKSVFRVTRSPLIFSCGFCFCLPEEDEETGLGYIVPRWVSDVPDMVPSEGTTILLPLNKSGVDPDSILRLLRNLSPETILFLEKLESLEINVDLPSLGQEYSCSVIKDELKRDGNSKLVQLTCARREKAEGNMAVETSCYWVTEVEHAVPQWAAHEKRAGIQTRVVSVAIPIGGGRCRGKLYAYLPVWEETGVPFLINADFLLVSSREGVREDAEWNKWLRDCTADTYLSGLLALLAQPQLPLETKVKGYASIPVDTQFLFLHPLVESVKQYLRESSCILVLPDLELVTPTQSRSCVTAVRNLLRESETLPEHLTERVHLLIPELEGFGPSLKAIGVTSLLSSDLLKCLNEEKWLALHPILWFLELFKYLKTAKIGRDQLREIKIVPVAAVDREMRLSCDNEQPTYLTLTPDQKKVLKQAPDWLRELVPIAILHSAFLDAINKDSDSESLILWMQDVLQIYEFSLDSYCVDVLNKLANDYISMTAEQILQATMWLQQNAPEDFDWDALPVISVYEQKILLSQARLQEFVVPEGLNPKDGWQHIWAEGDRAHFTSLSDLYSQLPEEWFIKLKIKKYPGFRKDEKRWWEVPGWLNDEKALADRCYRESAMSRSDEIVLRFPLRPSSLTKIDKGTDNNDAFARALIAFLGTLEIPDLSSYSAGRLLYEAGLYAVGMYENRGTHYKYGPTTLLKDLQTLPWLPTTKGFSPPSETFLYTNSIREVLGDTVPYYKGPLAQEALRLLQVRLEITVKELLNLLKRHIGKPADLEMLQRVYAEINNRTERGINDIQSIFEKEPLIYVPSSHRKRQWFKSVECVWCDASSVLGEDFAYLEKVYPKLNSFFIKQVGTKEKADAEIFARRWLIIQENPPEDLQLRRAVWETLYRQLKPVTLLEKEDRPAWWDAFATEKAKLFTESDRFVAPTDLFISDDGVLHDILSDEEDVEFAWRPENSSLDDYVRFYLAFNAPLLTESVSERLKEEADVQTQQPTTLLTESAVKMVAAWLREKRAAEFERLLEERVFDQLFSIQEAITHSDITVDFEIITDAWTFDPITVSYPAFWDRTSNVLLYRLGTDPIVIAEALAKKLISNYKDLAGWIELTFGAATTDRLKYRSWHVPQEIINCCKRLEASVPTEDAIDAPKLSNGAAEENQQAEIQKVNDSDGKGIDKAISPVDAPEMATKDDAKFTGSISGAPAEAPSSPSRPALQTTTDAKSSASNTAKAMVPENYGSTLKEAFTKEGHTDFTDNHAAIQHNSVDATLPNPARRSEKLHHEYSEKIQEEPTAEGRRKEVERLILEGPSEAVRASLYAWYGGQCQICGETWPRKDGSPFFVAAYLVERQYARWLDNPGNAICLCAKHFAQWRLAAKQEDQDVKRQVLDLRVQAEGGSGDLEVYFKMLGQPCSLKYKERHLLALRELIKAAEIHNAQNVSEGTERHLPESPHATMPGGEVYRDRRGHEVTIYRRSAPPTADHTSPIRQQECPYCHCMVNHRNFESHIEERCINRPKPPAALSSHGPEKSSTSGKLRCRFCDNLAIPGSDVCYTCS